MMVATSGCQSLPTNLSPGSKMLTLRRSSRLRPVSRLWAALIGAAVAAICSICWWRVGWLSLT